MFWRNLSLMTLMRPYEVPREVTSSPKSPNFLPPMRKKRTSPSHANSPTPQRQHLRRGMLKPGGRSGRGPKLSLQHYLVRHAEHALVCARIQSTQPKPRPPLLLLLHARPPGQGQGQRKRKKLLQTPPLPRRFPPFANPRSSTNSWRTRIMTTSMICTRSKLTCIPPEVVGPIIGQLSGPVLTSGGGAYSNCARGSTCR